MTKMQSKEYTNIKEEFEDSLRDLVMDCETGSLNASASDLKVANKLILLVHYLVTGRIDRIRFK